MSFYQKFKEGEETLELFDHTLKKANLVAKAAGYLLENQKQKKEISVLDVGSAEGLVSMDLLKRFPDLDISLTQVNPTVIETDTAQRLIAKYYPGKKLEIISGFFAQVPQKMYDIVVFFAIFHHILHTYRNAQEGINHLAGFIGEVGIIEVPLAQDALLNIWKGKNPETDYTCLSSVEAFAKLLSTHFNVLHTERLEYDTNSDRPSDLYRWSFIVQKKKEVSSGNLSVTDFQ